MKKVLIITYYWPPVNSAGVYRWLKFVKYFREFGIEPVVYTIEREDTGKAQDLFNDIPKGVEVIKRPIKDPFDFFQAVRGKKKGAQPGFLKEKAGSNFLRSLLFRIRGNFFIPDAKKYWIKPSVKFLLKYLKENGIDTIISTGPPHSMHMIGLHLKRRADLKWVADFRDPWTKIDFYERLGLTGYADRKHKRLEREVIAEADEVVTVSRSWAEEMEQDHDRNINLITNGFDDADFAELKPNKPAKFTIVQVGSMNEDRDPIALWEALKDLLEKGIISKESLAVKLVGPVDHKVKESYIDSGLSELVEVTPLVPHSEAVQEMVNAHLLLLPINDASNMSGIIPGKLYEYLRSRTPILCLGAPDGDSAKIVLECKAGTAHAHNDVQGIRNVVLACFERTANAPQTEGTEQIQKYSRRELAGAFAALVAQ